MNGLFGTPLPLFGMIPNSNLMNYSLKPIIISLLFILSISASGQTGLIKGRIQDNQDNPIPNANISIDKTSFGGTTNAAGNYLIKKIPAGNYKIIFSAVGFQSITKSVEGQNL